MLQRCGMYALTLFLVVTAIIVLVIVASDTGTGSYHVRK
jgi:hypothetical protein